MVEGCLLFPMSTLKAILRAAIYATFLNPVGHLQLLQVALSARYTNYSWYNSLA